MTYQYLTVDMVQSAKTNGGFIDQKMFKTSSKYGFDSLYLTNTSMQVLDGYITFIRPFLKPDCDYVLVTRNGRQHSKIGQLMSKLVFDATGKYILPTRYRQIIETVSRQQLVAVNKTRFLKIKNTVPSWPRCIIMEKHRSREIATKAHACLQKLHGEKGTELNTDVLTRLSHSPIVSPQQDHLNDSLSELLSNLKILRLIQKVTRTNLALIPNINMMS